MVHTEDLTKTETYKVSVIMFDQIQYNNKAKQIFDSNVDNDDLEINIISWIPYLYGLFFHK